MKNGLRTCVVLVFTVLVSVQLWGQAKERAKWKNDYISDLSNTGVGITLYKPNMGIFSGVNQNWVGADILLSAFHVSFSQGTYTRPGETPFFPNQNATVTVPTVRVSRATFGLNAPLPFIGFGRYNSYNDVLRGHLFLRLNGGYHSFRQRNDKRNRTFSGELAPGFRLRFPYGSFDFALSITQMAVDGLGDQSYTVGLPKTTIVPTFTLRLDGFFDGMKVGYNRSVGASVSSSSTQSKRRYTDVSGRRMEETTTTYQATITPKTVTVTDIGKYIGLGLKGTISGMATRSYSPPGALFGANIMGRSGLMLFGLNIEGGRVGHASELVPWKDGHRRFVERREEYGAGNISTFNIYGDFGLSLNNLIYAAMGTVILDEVSTPFSSINVGVSFGLNAMWNQTFIDPQSALPVYNLVEGEKRRWFIDPRDSKGGLMGGYFFSWDIGNASLRAQWYRYRRAPLANSLMYSVIWRFGGSE